jgi:hypothetical protein
LLYEKAVRLKHVSPEKSVALLEEACGQAGIFGFSQELNDKIMRLFDELYRPDVIYRRVLALKDSDPHRAREILEGFFSESGRRRDITPDSVVKRRIIQQMEQLLKEVVVKEKEQSEKKAKRRAIFEEWTRKRDVAIRRAAKGGRSGSRINAFMRLEEPKLLKELIQKHKITSEDLDRIIKDFGQDAEE